MWGGHGGGAHQLCRWVSSRLRCGGSHGGRRQYASALMWASLQLKCGGVMDVVRAICAGGLCSCESPLPPVIRLPIQGRIPICAIYDLSPGFAYKRPYAAFLDYFWPLAPEAMHEWKRLSVASEVSGRAEGNQQLVVSGPPPPSDALREAVRKVLLSAVGAASSSLSGEEDATTSPAAAAALSSSLSSEYQLGATKVFLKGRMAATLDQRRSAAIRAAATRVQAAYRCHIARSTFLAMRAAALAVQTAARGWLARRLVQRLRRERAAVRIQVRIHIAASVKLCWDEWMICFVRAALQLDHPSRMLPCCTLTGFTKHAVS